MLGWHRPFVRLGTNLEAEHPEVVSGVLGGVQLRRAIGKGFIGAVEAYCGSKGCLPRENVLQVEMAPIMLPSHGVRRDHGCHNMACLAISGPQNAARAGCSKSSAGMSVPGDLGTCTTPPPAPVQQTGARQAL